jgi:hypothetical protein
MGHAAFLGLILSNEVSCRHSHSATLRARAVGLDTQTEPEDLHYDRMLLSDQTSLAFTHAHHGALIPGPLEVSKTPLHKRWDAAIRRRMRMHASPADKLVTRLRAAGRDSTLHGEVRHMARVDLSSWMTSH